MKNIIFSSIFTLLLTVGCSSLQIKQESTVNIPEHFSNLPSEGTLQDLSHWWRIWNDIYLSELIEEGLKNNLSLKAAEENSKAAFALFKTARADLWPIVGLGAKIGKQNPDISDPLLKNVPLIKDKTIELENKIRSVNFSASWEPDIFNKKKSDQDAAYYNALSSAEALYGAQILISAQIAGNYFEAATIKKQINNLEEAIKISQEILRYTKGRFNAGQITYDIVHKVESSLSALSAQKEPLLAQYKTVEQSIATLIGKEPQHFNLMVDENILDEKTPLPTGIQPGDLLQRRPDLRAKSNIIKALVAKSASARADLFPRFYIDFSLLNGRIGINDLLNSSVKAPLFNVGVELPIFTAGRIKQNIKSADARLKAAGFDYDHNLLQALQETDSLYALIDAIDKQEKGLEKSYKESNKKIIASNKLYQAGYYTYDTVLTDKIEEIKLNEKRINTKRNKILAIIKLYQALGGGWQENKP